MDSSATTPANENTPQTTPYHNVKFHGSGKEYFSIWVVNLLLTILTLGIYSAWATVRTRRYFYRNTELNNSRFEFHGKPLNILIGRIIAVVALVLYSFSGFFSTYLSGAVLILLVILFPILFMMSWRFNLTNTSWRGIFLGLNAPPKSAYRIILPYFVYGLCGVLVSVFFLDLSNESYIGSDIFIRVVSFGIAYLIGLMTVLVIYFRLYNHVLNNSFFGTQNFAFLSSMRPWFKLMGKVVAAYLLISIVAALFFLIFIALSAASIPLAISYMLLITFYISFITLMMLPTAIWRVEKFNLILNHLNSDKLTLSSYLEIWVFFKLIVTNTLLIVLTLGIAYPWAAIRLARYMLENTVIKGDLESLEGKKDTKAAAVGDEVGSAFDWDIGV